MFVSFYQSPFTNLTLMEKYLYYVPYLHAGVTVLIFLVIPVFIIFDTLIQQGDINGSVYKSTLWIYCFTSIMVAFVWIPTQIWTVF
jgi:hypothetical protein